jgi:glycosyltransferase involved in cell wall biosynthesis
MKIAIVRREPKVAFSMDVYADNLVKELKALRPEWEIIEIAPEPWSKDLDNLWHSGNPLRKYYERFFNHPRQVSKLEADIFHIIDHTNAHVAYWLKKSGKRVIITCHDLVQYVYPEILKNQSRFPALSMAVWQYSVKGITVADRTISVSTNTAKDITNWLNIDPQKITVVPNGVESEFRFLSPEVVSNWRQQYVHSSAEICLLNVGSTHQRKNILTVLKVIKAISAQKIPVRLWKIGDDFSEEQQQFISNFSLDKYITFLGKPDRESLIRFYNAADVLLAPSLYEGFGLTILEAMACGTPVITSNVSSLPEVAGNAAILVNPTDVETITTSILRLRQDALYRQEIIEQGLARVKNFTWANNVKQIIQLYEDLVNKTNQIVNELDLD